MARKPLTDDQIAARDERRAKTEGRSMTYHRRLRITSHVGLTRYHAQIEPAGYIVRQPAIPSPYAWGPNHAVYQDLNRGPVFIVETAHRRYDVFTVPAELTIYRTDEESTAAYVHTLHMERQATT